MKWNYWTSTQHSAWLFPAGSPESLRLPSQHMKYHDACLFIIRHTSACIKWPLVVVYTAMIYFKRYFAKTVAEPSDNDAKMIALVALYTAAKVEELGQIQSDLIIMAFVELIKTINKLLTNKANNVNILMKNSAGTKSDIERYLQEELTTLSEDEVAFVIDDGFILHLSPSELFSYELNLLDSLNCDLIIYHPLTLMETLVDQYLSINLLKVENFEEYSRQFKIKVYSIMNFSYKTDMMLLYPPHFISIASIFIGALVSQVPEKDLLVWLQTLNVNQVIIADSIAYFLEVMNSMKIISS